MAHPRARVWLIRLVVHGDLTLCQKWREVRQNVRQLGVRASIIGAGPEGDAAATGHLFAQLLDYFTARGSAEPIIRGPRVDVCRLDLGAFPTQALHAVTNPLGESGSSLVALLGHDYQIVCAQGSARGPGRG